MWADVCFPCERTSHSPDQYARQCVESPEHQVASKDNYLPAMLGKLETGAPWHGEILLGRISLYLGRSQARERSLLSVHGTRDIGGSAWYMSPMSPSTPAPPGELPAYWEAFWDGLCGYWLPRYSARCPSGSTPR